MFRVGDRVDLQKYFRLYGCNNRLATVTDVNQRFITCVADRGYTECINTFRGRSNKYLLEE